LRGDGLHLPSNFRYKHSRVKQYLKERRALCIETVIDKPWGLNILARIEHLPELVDRVRHVNHHLLITEHAGQALPSALQSLSASTGRTYGRASERHEADDRRLRRRLHGQSGAILT
jgi:hypothetical protein